MAKWMALLVAGMAAASAAWAQPQQILFVGNSFTYTRPPALQYNAAQVEDMNYANFLANPRAAIRPCRSRGAACRASSRRWPTTPGSSGRCRTRCAAARRLRGHYLNTNPAGWDMRANIAAQRWDVVVLQGNSTEAVARAGGDPLQFTAYVNKLERWVHVGAAETYQRIAALSGRQPHRADHPRESQREPRRGGLPVPDLGPARPHVSRRAAPTPASAWPP